MWRSALAFAAALLAGAAAARGAGEPLAAPQTEEAAALARRAAEALGGRHLSPLAGLFDENAMIASAVGPALAPLLTVRQRRAVADRMYAWFSAPFAGRPAPAKAATVLGVGGNADAALVALLVPVSSGYLKTEWSIRAPGPEGRIEDVRLTDLGRSLRHEAVESLGPAPIARRRDRPKEARRAAWPRAAGFAGVAVVAAIFARRSRPRERIVVLLAALAPAILFAADGWLAVSRVWNEPVELSLSDGPPWVYALQQFQYAAVRRNRARARTAAAEAIARGARPQPLDLALGLLAEEAGDDRDAAAAYTRALAPPHPAPGGWAGLARLDSAAGRDTEAIENWTRYFAAAPADPNALFWEAVAWGHLHAFDEAQDALARAIELNPSAPEVYALSASLYGAAGDAASAIARLRDEERIRPVARGALASDGNFAPIAGDPAWRKFLDEKKP